MAADNPVRRAVTVAHALRDAAVELETSHAGHVRSPHSEPEKATLDKSSAGPVSVFVSWAHRGESWSDERSAEWAREVVEFTSRLRSSGLDAELDLFHTHETEVDWTRFGQRQVSAATYVIIAISAAWAERWSGTNNPQVGAGAVVECDTLKGIMQRDQSAFQTKVLVVILPSQSLDDLPPDMARLNHFRVDPEDPDSFDDLIRSMTSQPRFVKNKLGAVPVLPPGVRETLKVRTSKARTEDYSSFLAVKREIDRMQKMSNLDERSERRLQMLLGVMDALEE